MSTGMHQARIMVVEDERIVALNLRQQLEKLGYEVPVVVSSGEQALERLQAERPDLILMDIRIEGPIDGIDTAARIPADLSIPVVYLTAYSEEATLERAKATQPFGYLLKPFSERELHATIQMAMERNAVEKGRREESEKRQHAQKLEAIGQLAGGIAHDFNNLLAVVQGNLELVLDRVDDDDASAMIDSALQAVRRGAALTQQLLAYARRQPLSPALVQLPDVVRELVTLLDRLLGGNITVATDLPADLRPVRVDQDQLLNALLNLSVNARDAMADGGRLDFIGRNVHRTSQYGQDPDGIPAGHYIALTVRDSGTGMSDEILQVATNPFFTTKAPGQGTGLGLSQVSGFVRQSGGFLQIHSKAGEGTSVVLYLPAVLQATTEPPPVTLADGNEPAAPEGVMVLLVEDNVSVRLVLEMYLEKLGYQYIAVDNAQEAWRLLEEGVAVDLLVSDLMLPGGMSGQTLIARARSLRPALKVLVISGHTYIQRAGSKAGEQAGKELPSLQKPFSRDTFARTLRSILSNTEAMGGPH